MTPSPEAELARSTINSSPSKSRCFTIADAMILTVAAAVGTLFVKSYLPAVSWSARYSDSQSASIFRPLQYATIWLHGPGSCVVVPLMQATIALRLRHPWPRLRRVIRQPGFVACFAAAVSLIPGTLWFASIRHRPGFAPPREAFDQAWECVIYLTESAVIGAWLALVQTRRWRASPDWVDRFGRMLGAYWIFLFGAGTITLWISKLWTLIS
jgi:hypothetical protein